MDADLSADTAKVTEVRKMKSPSEDGLKRILDKISENAVPSNSSISDEGQIARMAIPEGWSRSREKHSLPAAANFVEIHSDKQPKAKIVTYYRGHRISPAAGKTFHQLLKSPPRVLSDAEYASLSEVVRDKAKPADFEVTSKKTINWNGRRVLLVEGKFKEINQKAYAIYVDADGTGEVVQEVFYQAPEADYPQYQKAAEAALRSIAWK